ncbi:AAA family ATPase [Flavobacterium flavigenum]|uniref:AAA family ATPase n=1 Tax=Flavobacterium flavigenum TaxID=3003258 RepID=UPI0024826601|nr:AAA family ATPase [Flavobacterium flavigenum]
MNKEEILNLIVEKQNHIKIIKEKFEALDFEDDKLCEYYKELSFTENYLFDISKELEDEIIPKIFYKKIYNNISAVNTNNLFNTLNNPNYVVNTDSLKTYCEHNKLNTIGAFVTYKFYKDLGFFTENIVVVGANGSGKSTLANNLKTVIDEKDGIVIPAQKLLIIPTFDNTPNYNSSSKEYDDYQKNYRDNKVTYNASKTDDIPYSETKKYGSEYKYVLKTLIAERAHIRNTFCTNFSKDLEVNKDDLHSKLDTAIEIWNSLIEHREMFFNESNELMIKDPSNGNDYPAYKMSDGEKNILYLIGRVLLTNTNSLIIIDEPEMYLHKAIVNKLWDKLEVLKQDCIFVYLSHDLDFASSRKAQKYWIKNFQFPINWDIENIPENDIPENLLMKLLGSRKRILFCEGKINSLDIKIFEILFPNFTITPLSSCKDVINYVRSFNKIPNRNVEAIGFIDRDFRIKEQLEKLETENIYSYSVSEIENLFLIKEFVAKYAEYKKENIDLQKLEDKVLKLLDENKVLQASNFASSNINYNFSESHVKKGNDLKNVKANLETFIANLSIENVYNERIKLLEKIVNDKDYQQAIMHYNNKGILGIVEDILSLKSNSYRLKALDFLKINEEAQNIIKKALPSI